MIEVIVFLVCLVFILPLAMAGLVFAGAALIYGIMFLCTLIAAGWLILFDKEPPKWK